MLASAKYVENTKNQSYQEYVYMFWPIPNNSFSIPTTQNLDPYPVNSFNPCIIVKLSTHHK